MIIYMYITPEQGKPWSQFLFQIIKIQSICQFTTSFTLQMTFYNFTHSNAWETQVDLAKIGQGHPRVMIYTNFVELHCLMLHAKFQNHRPSGSGEDF